MPITAGSAVTLTCLLKRTVEDIYFEWDCIKNKIVIGTKVHQNNLTFSTLIIRNLNLTHDNETCTCSVHVESITSKYSFQVSISSKYKISIKFFSQHTEKKYKHIRQFCDLCRKRLSKSYILGETSLYLLLCNITMTWSFIMKQL